MRFPDVIATLPPKEVMVMGGMRDLLFCLKKGYRFYWSGIIYYGFKLFIFSGKNNLFSDFILSLRKMFLKDINTRYLFLFNDCFDEGITLSFALKFTPKLNIVCIEHGVISFNRPENPVKWANGQSCKFNLVWDVFQKKNFLKMTKTVHLLFSVCHTKFIQLKVIVEK